MEYIEIGSRSHRRAAGSMLVGGIITFATMYSPQPLITLFSEEYGISPAAASTSISITTMALAISMLFISSLSNIWGRKGIMCISLTLTSILSIASIFCTNFDMFLMIRLLEGISIAGFPSVAMAYLQEEFSPKSLGAVMGSYVAGSAIGGFTGRIAIGALTDLTNWHVAFLVQGLLSLLGAFWFWKCLPDSRNFKKRSFSFVEWGGNMKATLLHRKLVPMYLVGFILMGVYITVMNYIGYPLTQAPYNLSQTVFGFLFVVNLVGSWSSIWFGKLADRHNRKAVISLAVGIFIVGGILTMNDYLVVKIIGVAAVVFGFFAGHSVVSSWVGMLAPKEYKGQASAFYLFFYYGGSSFLGWSSGYVMASVGWNGLMLYISLLACIAILLACQPSFRLLSKGLREPFRIDTKARIVKS